MCKNAHTRIRAGSLSHARGAYGHAKGHSRSWHDVLIGVKAWLGLPVPERTAKVNTKQASDVSSDCGESEPGTAFLSWMSRQCKRRKTLCNILFKSTHYLWNT